MIHPTLTLLATIVFSVKYQTIVQEKTHFIWCSVQGTKLWKTNIWRGSNVVCVLLKNLLENLRIGFQWVLGMKYKVWISPKAPNLTQGWIIQVNVPRNAGQQWPHKSLKLSCQCTCKLWSLQCQKPIFLSIYGLLSEDFCFASWGGRGPISCKWPTTPSAWNTRIAN